MARLFTVGEIIAATGGRAEGLTGGNVCSLSMLSGVATFGDNSATSLIMNTQSPGRSP